MWGSAKTENQVGASTKGKGSVCTVCRSAAVQLVFNRALHRILGDRKFNLRRGNDTLKALNYKVLTEWIICMYWRALKCTQCMVCSQNVQCIVIFAEISVFDWSCDAYLTTEVAYQSRSLLSYLYSYGITFSKIAGYPTAKTSWSY